MADREGGGEAVSKCDKDELRYYLSFSITEVVEMGCLEREQELWESFRRSGLLGTVLGWEGYPD